MLRKALLISLAAVLFYGCAATSALSRFEASERISQVPVKFADVSERPAQVDAIISLRAPGLRGRAEGIVRHANGGQYLIELYGREQLFLKVYFTSTQTVLWPTTGMPEFFGQDEMPMLNAAVHSRLPKWRLDDVLPVPFGRGDADDSDWRMGVHGPIERIEHADCTPLIKQYLRESDDRQFPYRKVVLSNESGSSKLVWSLRDSHHE